MTSEVQKQLDALAAHLRQRRNDLLAAWRESVCRDPELTTGARLPRSALDDHIPKILDDFERRLHAEHALAAAKVDLEQRQDAAEHGMHRWQQGYDIRETLREWGHLHAVLLRELERYGQSHPQSDADAMSAARETLASLCMDGNCESASRHVRLQQAEAASRVKDFEASLSTLQTLENERAALLRETAHDLRGSFGVIANAAGVLAKADVTAQQRDHFHDLLQKRIRSMASLLGDLAELARLEAGQDPLKLEIFDAAERLREQCELLRPLAAERSLFLKCEGPASLAVESDWLKLQRIVQNLVLNALKATQRGGVLLRWSEGVGLSTPQWVLSVSDTGPGFTLQSTGPLRNALKRATDQAHQVSGEAAPGDAAAGPSDRSPPPAAASGPGSASLPSGEGLGLSIVKRLCEVLSSTLELETAPGRGTTVRLTLPLHYAQ